jgi:hypothetical protein
MSALLDPIPSEYSSGDVVEPGIYLDIETGAIVKIQERDELPEGSRVVRYPRRFRRLEPALLAAKG